MGLHSRVQALNERRCQVRPKYKRVLLKLSGEALEGSQGYGIEPQTLETVASQIQEISDLGIQLAVVIGGGNLFRGLSGAASGMNRSSADTMGMLATMMNCLAMEDSLRRREQSCLLLTAVPMGSVAETFTRRRAVAALESGNVVLLAAGTGNPFFTTDTAAALRALEIGADVLLKATKVDGVYDKDPKQHVDAVKFDKLTYTEVLTRQLKVMDLTAITLCRDNKMPLLVFDLTQEGNIKKAVQGESIGSEIVD